MTAAVTQIGKTIILYRSFTESTLICFTSIWRTAVL